MVILVSKKDRTVQDFTMSYTIDENGTYISENMQGKQVEFPYAEERFDITDIDDESIAKDEAGNYISFKREYWIYVDNELVKNPEYTDPDEEAKRKAREAELRSLEREPGEILLRRQVYEFADIPPYTGTQEQERTGAKGGRTSREDVIAARIREIIEELELMDGQRNGVNENEEEII